MCVCVCVYRERDFKESTHAIMEAGKTKLCQPCRLAGWIPSKDLQLESKGSLPEELLCSQGKSVFYLLRPSTGWMRPTDLMESNLL